MPIKRKNLQGITWVVLALIWVIWRYDLSPFSWSNFIVFLIFLIPSIIPGFLIFFRENPISYEFNITDFLHYFLFTIFAFVSIFIIYTLTGIILMGLSDANVF